MNTRKHNQKRYNLHRDIRKEGYRLKSRARTIYVFLSKTELSEKVQRLRDEFGYAIQIEIDQQ